MKSDTKSLWIGMLSFNFDCKVNLIINNHYQFQKVEVQAPPGQVVGYVHQAWSICVPKFKICDATGNTVLRIEGPCCTCNLCGDVEFQVFNFNIGNSNFTSVKSDKY